jgi:hypothetical protein
VAHPDSRFLAKATRNDSLRLSVINYANMAERQIKRALHFAEALFETTLNNEKN